MKKFALILFAIVSLQVTNMGAISFTDMLPGGKNYLDPNNLILDSSSVETDVPFRIKGDTDYTLRFPGDMQIGLADVYIYGEEEYYITGNILELTECEMGPSYNDCTFHTVPSETHLNIRIEARDIDLYHAHYGYDGFQLEEGLVATSYEPYEPPFEDTSDPEFTGSAMYVKSYDEVISLATIIDNYVYVYDEIDGDLSDSISITSDPYSANMDTIGDYIVELAVSDSAGNTATFDFTIIVNDTIDPNLSGPNEVDVSVDDATPLSEIVANNYSSFDDYDGNLGITVTSDQYSASMNIVGSYPVTISTVDSSGNRVSKTIQINVNDLVAPTLQSNPSIDVHLSNPQTMEDIITGLVVADNYSPVTGITIDVHLDDYSTQRFHIGTYEVIVNIKDEANNMLQTSIFITVIDDVAPTIIGPAMIHTSYVTPYSMEEILAMLSVTDNHDALTNNDLLITNNTYENRSGVVGTFEIVVQLTDQSSNMATHNITVQVIDDQNPVFYVDSHLITVSQQAMFQPIDALNMLVANGIVPEGEYQIDIINDEYSGHETKPGTYDYKLLFTDKQGSTYEHDFEITVTDDEQTVVDTPGWVRTIRTVAVYSTLLGVVTLVLIRYKK
jgi:hypothetical protein